MLEPDHVRTESFLVFVGALFLIIATELTANFNRHMRDVCVF